MRVTSRVANQDTHEVVTLAIDQRTGLLRPTGHARRVATDRAASAHVASRVVAPRRSECNA